MSELMLGSPTDLPIRRFASYTVFLGFLTAWENVSVNIAFVYIGTFSTEDIIYKSTAW